MLEIVIAGIAIGMFAISLIVKFGISILQKRMLVVILSLWVLRFFLYYLKTSEYVETFPFLILLDQNLFFLDGVLLLFYTQSFYRISWKRPSTLLHFLPFLLACTLSFISYQLISADELTGIYNEAISSSPKPTLPEMIFISILVIHNLVYLWLSRKNVQEYHRDILSNYSDISSINLQWLDKLIMVWLVFLIIPLSIYFASYLFASFDLEFLSNGLLLAMLVLLIVFSYFGVHQEYVYLNPIDNKAKSLLSESEKEDWVEKYDKLDSFMVLNQPYLDPLLNINKLAEQFGVSVAEISNTINKGGNLNFYEFVNSYRIKEIREKLLRSDDQVIQIAYSHGFNSKSTFYSVFRNAVKMTPTEYRKKYGPHK